MNLMQEIIANAQANRQRIVLPEGDEPRTLKAADRLLADEIDEFLREAATEDAGKKPIARNRVAHDEFDRRIRLPPRHGRPQRIAVDLPVAGALLVLAAVSLSMYATRRMA